MERQRGVRGVRRQGQKERESREGDMFTKHSAGTVLELEGLTFTCVEVTQCKREDLPVWEEHLALLNSPH